MIQGLKEKIKKLSRKQLYALLAVLVISVSGISFYVYKVATTSPVGVSDTVPSQSSGGNEVPVIEEIATPAKEGDSTGGNNYNFLHNSKANIVKDGNPEFESAYNLEKSLLTLLQSNNINDLTLAKEYWLQNSTNYDFTKPQNMNVASIAEDVLKYYNHRMDTENLSNKAKLYEDKTLGQLFSKQAKSPFATSLIFANSSVVAYGEVFKDNASHILKPGKVVYKGALVFKDVETARSKGSQIEYLDPVYKQVIGLNKTSTLFDAMTHAVYEVYLSVDGKDVVSIVRENIDGTLDFQGFYYLKYDENVANLQFWFTEKANGRANVGGYSEEDLNWNILKKYLG